MKYSFEYELVLIFNLCDMTSNGDHGFKNKDMTNRIVLAIIIDTPRGSNIL